MKVCMIGLGSIGKRHVTNMIKMFGNQGIEYRIDALRSSYSIVPEELDCIINHQYFDVKDLPDDYDVIFITNPTVCHYESIKKVINKTQHMFIEKPIFDSLNYDLSSVPLKKGSIYYVACPLRHKSILKYVKQEVLKNEKVISARIVSTSYLPLWRKSVDYRKVYSAQKDMGGGVTKDLIHEWDYALYLFGNPTKVFHLQSHMSNLEIDSDDISVYLAEYPHMILEMHLDYIGHKTERILQLFMNNKRVDVDLIANEMFEYVNDKLIDRKKFPDEDYYVTELEYFFDCLQNKKTNINTIENAYHTLKVAMTEE